MASFVRFGLVGGAGYVVNLAVYGGAVHAGHVDYRIAAVIAFCVALSTTFLLNRHYTFRAGHHALSVQAPRYLAVSMVGFAVNLLALQLLVDGAHLPAVVAQALAIGIAAPVNFAGQRLWTFPRSTAAATNPR